MIPLLLAMIPLDIPTDKVCELELNHYYCNEGNLVFTQVIFWDIESSEPCRRVVAWRLWKDPSKTPVKIRGGWELIWNDGETLRRVRADSFYVTHSQRDPEMTNRNVWPTHMRRGLFTRRTEATLSKINESDLTP